ncbi:MAG TPA: FrgA protein [Myxococcaceae bacterium]
MERATEALRIQAVTGGSMDTVLLELGFVPEPTLLEAMGEVSAYRPVNLADFEPNFEVAPLIPPKIADRLCVAPLSTDGPALHVACGYPVKKAELDEVAFLLGKQLELWVGIEARIRDWISIIYRQPLAARFSSLLVNIDPTRPAPAPVPTPPPVPAVSRPAPAPATAKPPPPPPEARAPAPPQGARGQTLAAPPPEPKTTAYPRSPKTVEYPREPKTTEYPREPKTAEYPALPRELGPEPPTPVEDVVPQALDDEPVTPARPPPPPLALTPTPPPLAVRSGAQKPSAQKPSLIEERTLEDALTAEMVDRLAQSVADEPIPLEVRKLPRPEPGAARASIPAEVVAFDRTQGPPPAPADVAPPPDAGDFVLEEPPTEPGALPVPRPSPPPAAPPEYPSELQRALLPIEPEPDPEPPTIIPQAPPPRLALPALPPVTPDVPPAAPPPDQTVPEWSLQEARAQLKEATVDRDRIIEVALRYGRRTFDLVAAFAVIRGSAMGWDVRGEALEPSQIAQVSIPLDSASVFRTVALSRGSYVGPLPPDSLSKHFLELFGRSPRTVFLFPVEVRSRLVAILYGDSGTKQLSQRKLSDYILFCQDLPGAFQELLVRRKQRAGAILLDDVVDVPLGPGLSRPAGAAVPKGLGWSPFASASTEKPGRAASVPAHIVTERERPPPDFGPLLRRLTGPDATERARAVAELARSPEASSRVLAQSFPGPTAWSRLPLLDLPEADELGPIPGALARLGRPAAQALAPLLDHADTDTRYFAMLTAGNLPFPELVDGVLRGLFDLDPDISSAARAASTALKRLARFEMAMKDLRQELASIDALRRSLAARALGVLHDREAIDGLINLTGSDDQMCAGAAAEALRDITKATFGTSPRQWTRWWAENRSRRRLEWLVAALRHPELEIRIASIEELTRAFNDHLGYSPDGPEAEREGAVRRWESLIHQRGRWERFDL